MKNWWKQYYWRVAGFAIGGAGAGLITDELIHGPFSLVPGNHEFWGLIMVIIGCIFISKKPRGKD